MVHITNLISAVALLSVASAAPMVRRQLGEEVPVSAPNGIVMSDPLPGSTDSASPPAVTSVDASPPSVTDSASIPLSIPDSASTPLSTPDSSVVPPSAPPSFGGESGGYGSSGYGDHGDNFDSTIEVATSTALSSIETSVSSYPQYGSGSSSWNYGSSYESCIQQCVATYGRPPSWSPPPPSSSSSYSGGGSVSGGVDVGSGSVSSGVDSGSGSISSGVDTGSGSSVGSSVSGTGVTHTVIVAPTQGVLRYIPFSTNASVGDVVHYEWHANKHTVTRSSALEVCNKTSVDTFASGIQNQGFSFDVVVNDTKPIWFYCGVPTHCQAGMFGGVNIEQADPTGGEFMSLGSMIPNMTASDPNMRTMFETTKKLTGNNAVANGMGMNINVAGMDPTTMGMVFQNAMFMQSLVAMNPNSVDAKGTFNPNAPNMTWPVNFSSMNSTDSTGGMTPASGAASGTAAPASASSSPSPKPHNGAGALTSPRVIVGLVAVIATLFVL